MSIWEYGILFFLGACFVSCGNCIRYREAKGLDWVYGHSVCESCGTQLRVWELVPVVSCIVLRGKCSKCGYYFGFGHAQSEAIGGAACILLGMFSPDLIRASLSAVTFGIVYCVLSYLQGHSLRQNLH